MMGLNTHEAQQMGRIEEGVKILVDRADGQEERVLRLEGFASRTKGALAILSLLFTIGCAWIVAGCAHYHHNEYVDGERISSTTSTVLGTGETSFVRICEDGVEGYTTKDTGLSDNGKQAIEDAVAAGVRAAIPGLP
jgi:hypothetical protein